MGTDKEKIKRFTTGRFSFNDYMSVSSLFGKHENDEELKTYMQAEWAETESTLLHPEKLNNLLDRLHHRINLNEYSGENSFSRFYKLVSRIAVILLIPALVTIVFLTNKLANREENGISWAEIHSPAGSRTQFQLPDGTKGWLNGESSIKYPIDFTRQRKVEMTGEAWFDVAHLKSEDFMVITPYFDIKVLGTQFNVVAYQDEKTAEIILEEGKVTVLGKNRQVISELIPDQQLVLNKVNGELTVQSVDSKSYTSWKDGLLVFRNVSMAEMAIRLERRYNTEIILHGDSLKSSVFRATFTDESLEDICKMLSSVAPVKYKIQKREKLPDNTFTKSKIEMWLRN
jgi:ferric-dicitrate binding protein FerR (iron transport regulator)